MMSGAQGIRVAMLTALSPPAACLSRFNALSLVYLLFLLLLPWFPGPCRHGIPGKGLGTGLCGEGHSGSWSPLSTWTG